MRYVRPDESIIGATVSGTPDATYLAAWLTNGSPGYPVRTTGAMSLTASFSSRPVDVIAVVNHTIDEAASIALGGSLSSSIVTQPWQSNGMPANWYRRLTTSVSASSIALGVTGNTGPVIVGELYAGLSRTLPQLHLGRRLAPDKVFPWEGEFSSLAPYDSGVARPMRCTGQCIVTETQMNGIDAWFLSQRNGSNPTLILPDYPANVAWLCQFNYDADDLAPGEALVDGSPSDGEPEALFLVNFEIVEIPKVRW